MVTEASQTQDAPKEAAQAEADVAESPKSDDGAPGQTSEAETDHEQSEKPHAGTLQGDEDAKPPPPDLSEAPEQSTQVHFVSLALVNSHKLIDLIVQASTPKEVAVGEESK